MAIVTTIGRGPGRNLSTTRIESTAGRRNSADRKKIRKITYVTATTRKNCILLKDNINLIARM
jgi:hypothetical protein